MNWMSVVGLIFITVGTILSFVGTYMSDKEGQAELTNKIQEKNGVIEKINSNNTRLVEQNTELLTSNSEVATSNKDLFGQNKDMLLRIEKYQKDIEEKEKKIKELEEISRKNDRGTTSSIQFNGAYIVRQGGSTMMEVGTEESKEFEKLSNLEKQHKFKEIIEECDKMIPKYPRWYTPYFFKAVSLLNLDKKNLEEAVKLLEFTAKSTPGDPEFILPIADVYSKIGNKTRAEELRKTIPKEVISNIETQQKFNEARQRSSDKTKKK